MNDIDRRIIKAVTDYYREHQESPAICIVHPILYRNKTLYDVRIPLIPTLGITQEPTFPPPPIETVTIRIAMMNTTSRYGVIEKTEPIVCLSSWQVMWLTIYDIMNL